MKNMGKYILIGLFVAFAQWLFVVFMGSIWNGPSYDVVVTLSVGLFLAFELVVCTGCILSKLEEKKS